MAVPVDEGWLAEPEVLLAESARRFTQLHRQRYGHGDPGGPVEVVHARCRGTAAVDRPTWPAWDLREPGAARTSRPVRFRGHGSLDTPVFDRDVLALGQYVDGPAIVEEWTTTILVPPGWRATVDGLGDLVLERA
jgi:N-methylhydantoinase A